MLNLLKSNMTYLKNKISSVGRGHFRKMGPAKHIPRSFVLTNRKARWWQEWAQLSRAPEPVVIVVHVEKNSTKSQLFTN
jgi:hypothetical protein